MSTNNHHTQIFTANQQARPKVLPPITDIANHKVTTQERNREGVLLTSRGVPPHTCETHKDTPLLTLTM